VKLPSVSGKETVKALMRDGFVLVSQRGSHIKVRKFLQPIGKTTIIVPNHKEVKKGTLARILKQANITPNKFRRLLKN
jgi:predicted RNA binding protein YcfA (HicA-like mRNA interferase family)